MALELTRRRVREAGPLVGRPGGCRARGQRKPRLRCESLEVTMTSMWIPPEIVDRTAKTPSGYRVRNRMSVQIDTVVLHQTSFNRGSLPDNYLSVHAHYVVLPDGSIVQLHPVEAYLVASSAFNEDAISVEVVGNFPDERGHYWEGDKY